jgi:two-component system, OmpR family, phosphate regulon sensor histidine kinase PhoR
VQLPGPPSRVLQVNAATVRDPEQSLIGTILVFHDLTRIKQLENVRKEFVANVSHELRTPLSLIKGYVETLLDGAKEDPALTARFLQTIERHADRLTFLIDDLLAISQLESGQVAYNIQTVDLRGQVERVCSELEVRALERQVTLVNEVPADLWVRADADRLQQVLLNLIDNAIKYGRTAGSVRIGGRVVADSLVEGFVADDGPGIPPESQPRVFERFYRVDRARSREQGGTGLGLSIVKHIIQAHGGEVDVESQPGRGTTFRFTLPRAEAPPAFPDPVDEGDPAPVTVP